MGLLGEFLSWMLLLTVIIGLSLLLLLCGLIDEVLWLGGDIVEWLFCPFCRRYEVLSPVVMLLLLLLLFPFVNWLRSFGELRPSLGDSDLIAKLSFFFL